MLLKDESTITGAVTQSFSTTKRIPIEMLNQHLHFKEEEEHFNIEILKINEHYLRNSSIDNLKLKFQLNTLPEFVRYKFNEDTLVFYGIKTKAMKSSYPIMFKIKDETTGLRSEEIKVNVHDSTMLVENTNWQVIILYIFLIFFIALIVAVIYGAKDDQSEIHFNNTDNSNKGSDREENSIILTKSIINWEKKGSDIKTTGEDCKTVREHESNSFHSSFEFCDSSDIREKSRRFDDQSLMEDIEHFSNEIKSMRDEETVSLNKNQFKREY